MSGVRFAVSDVDELWQTNFNTARAHLTSNGVRPTSETLRRINGKARRLADEQTRRQVGDDEVWGMFLNARSRVEYQRPASKLSDLFANPPARSQRRAEAAHRQEVERYEEALRRVPF